MNSQDKRGKDCPVEVLKGMHRPKVVVGCPCPRGRKCECDFDAAKPAKKPLTRGQFELRRLFEGRGAD